MDPAHPTGHRVQGDAECPSTTQCARALFFHDGRLGGPQPLLLRLGGAAAADKHNVLLAHWTEGWDSAHHLRPAVPYGDGESHAVQETARSRLWGIEVRVAVKPD